MTWQRARRNPQPFWHGSSALLLPEAAAIGGILPSSPPFPRSQGLSSALVARVMSGVDFSPLLLQ